MASIKASRLLGLPTELLQLIPAFLHDIEDFKNLTSTCRTLRNTLSSTSPHTILHLCAAASRIFFRPDPAFLVAACASELNTWLASSEDNIPVFKEACEDGLDGLLKLCLGDAKCGLTMPQIRDLYLLRMSTINPIEDLIDKCVGIQWYATPNFWNGGVSDAYTIHADPLSTVFDLSIYGDIFGPAIDVYIKTGTVPSYARSECRAVFVKYCIPKDDQFWVDLEGNRCDPPVTRKRMIHEQNYYKEQGSWDWYQPRLALSHILASTRLKRAWNAMSQQLGDDVELRFSRPELDDVQFDDNDNEISDSNKYRLRKACFTSAGMQGLTQLARTGLGEYGKEVETLSVEAATRLKDLLPRISAVGGGENRRSGSSSIWPDLAADLYLFEMW